MLQKILDMYTTRFHTTYINIDLYNRNEPIRIDESTIHHGNLILVNKDYPLISSIINKYNHQIPLDSNHSVYLEEKVVSQFRNLMNLIKANDKIVPMSGYRSMQEQTNIFSSSMKENGIDFTKKYVALPGHSEHQTGLAIDVAEKKSNIDFICPDFPYTGICGQFRENASNYGFIERYPKGKEDITGIGHEPWHFRYVSYPHSEIMQNFGFTLEEYIHFLRNFNYMDEHLNLVVSNKEFEIFYVNQSDFSSFHAFIKNETRPYRISGNNVDGIIITVLNQQLRKTGVTRV